MSRRRDGMTACFFVSFLSLFPSFFLFLFFFSPVQAATTTVGGVITTSSICAYGNMMALGDVTITTSTQALGHVGVYYYDYRTGDYTSGEIVLENPFRLDTVTEAVQYGDSHTDVNGNAGFGHSLACVNDETLFVSAASKEYNSGRVYLYKGRNTHWTSQQILNSYHTTKSETYSTSPNTFFGEALASSESLLAVGCRNCNSTEKGYPESGEVYLFRPEEKKESVLWTQTQVLVGKDIYFLGGHVAMHENVVVASGDSQEEFVHNSISTTPILASIFMAEDYLAPKGPKSEFKYMHNVVTRDPLYQRVADVSVYDMTIAMATYDATHDLNNVYIFYPNIDKYGLGEDDDDDNGKGKGKKKPKPRPISWSLVQVLTMPAPVTDWNYELPTYLSLWNNQIFMTGRTSAHEVVLVTNRTARHQLYTTEFRRFSFVNTIPTEHMLTVSDYKLYLDGFTDTRTLNTVFDLTPSNFQCIQIWVEDEFDDGWDTAELVVESPDGIKRSYKTECDSTNPLVHRYCPTVNDEASSKGIHKLRIVHAKEAKFNWEILWKVYDESTATWYFGNLDTEMDFEWNYHYSFFHNTRMKDLRKNNITCTVCPQDKTEWDKSKYPSHFKKRISPLHNLRALHHRQVSASPTVSAAPTIAIQHSTDWNYFEMINDAGGTNAFPWFTGDGRGTNFYISDVDGKHLFFEGSGCTAGNVAISCYLELGDGDYVVRVTGANDPYVGERRWKFCNGLNYQLGQTEFYFSIYGGVCYPSLTRHQSLVCDNILKITNLHVTVTLTGDFSNRGSVTVETLQPVAVSVSNALQAMLGFEMYSQSVLHNFYASDTFIELDVNIGFKNLDMSKLSTLREMELGDRTANSLIKYEVLSATSSSAHDHVILQAIKDVSISNIERADETVDYGAEDESSFRSVTNFIPEASSFPDRPLWLQAEYGIAVFGYVGAAVMVLVAMISVVSSVRNGRNPLRPAITLSNEIPLSSSVKPSAARASLHLMNIDDATSSDESDDSCSSDASHDGNRQPLARKRGVSSIGGHSRRGKSSAQSAASTTPSRVNEEKLKRMVKNEDALFRNFISKQSSR